VQLTFHFVAEDPSLARSKCELPIEDDAMAGRAWNGFARLNVGTDRDHVHTWHIRTLQKDSQPRSSEMLLTVMITRSARVADSKNAPVDWKAHAVHEHETAGDLEDAPCFRLGKADRSETNVFFRGSFDKKNNQ